jgi:RimJ/RimL family protein N-acetyltransferase
MQLRASAGLIGWCGFMPGKPPIAGQVEIGWTLHPDFWRQGLALEAAKACLDWAWSNQPLARVMAITAENNLPSRRLMTRLGMAHVAGGDFDHPELDQGDLLRRHVLYRIDRPA